MKLIMNRGYRHSILAMLIITMLIATAALPGIVEAKSLYLAAEHHASLFDAWNINPDGTVTYQATYGLSHATDPAGVAIDSDSETLFITSEFSPGVEIVDPVTLNYLGVSTGPSNLAGIDVDDVNDIVYAVQRMTPNLYIFQWDPVALTLTEIEQIVLPNCMGAMGIALDEWRETLWVADAGSGTWDYDYFEVTGLGNTTVDIEVVSENFDWVMELLDSAGNHIEYAVDPSAGMGYPVKFTGVVPDGGAVYFNIWDLYGGTGDYQIAVWPTGSPTPSAPQDNESEPNDWFGDRNVIASTGEIVINGTIGISIPGWHPMVRAYDTNTWTEDTGRSFTPSHVPIDVAVDRVRNCVYSVSITGGATVPPGTGSTLLSKWDVATESETTVDMGYGGVGLAVDEVTGYVYVTGFYQGGPSGDNIAVWDTSTMPFTMIQDTGPIGNPAGVAIGNVAYNPLNLAKNDIFQGEGVYIGMTFAYEITFDSPAFDLTNVTVTDTLPVELDFVSATEGGVYDPVEHTVVWDLGDIAAGAPVPTLSLEVKVNQNAEPGATIYNYATIDGDQIPPTTVIDQDPTQPGDEPGTPVLPSIPATIRIEPETLNLNSKGVFTAFITLPEEFNVADIDLDTVECEGAPAIRGQVAGGHTFIAKFNRQDLVDVPTGDEVTLTVTGEVAGMPFIGSDTIRVID